MKQGKCEDIGNPAPLQKCLLQITFEKTLVMWQQSLFEPTDPLDLVFIQI